jgi:uncharacterized membrane protein
MRTNSETGAGRAKGRHITPDNAHDDAGQAVRPDGLPGDRQVKPRRRVQTIDMARGAALAAMAIYHFSWDLDFYGLADIPVTSATGWIVFARMIASSFLALVGVSLVLAARGGINWRGYGRRLMQVIAAAAAISLATWFLFPATYIFFGILHAIALFSVLALAFLRLPAWLILALAALAFAAPSLLSGPLFDQSSLLWTGLGTFFPPSNDYVPLFPWFGMTLAGMALAKIAENADLWDRLAGWRPDTALARLASFAGRHSLLVYLAHQPVLLALLGAVAWAVR